MPTANCGYPTSPDMLAQFGPTLQVNVGFDPGYFANPLDIPRPQTTGMLALVDTGASECFIDASLASVLNLPIVDRETVAAANGPAQVNVYAAQIYVPALNQIVSGRFAGVLIQPALRPFVALVGRSFLREFTMTYEGRTGRVILSND